MVNCVGFKCSRFGAGCCQYLRIRDESIVSIQQRSESRRQGSRQSLQVKTSSSEMLPLKLPSAHGRWVKDAVLHAIHEGDFLLLIWLLAINAKHWCKQCKVVALILCGAATEIAKQSRSLHLAVCRQL